MHPIALSRPDDPAKAIAAHAHDPQLVFIAGGTDLIGLMKDRAALPGLNRNHAIFGWSESCVATNPSDLAVALAAMDAVVIVLGKTGERLIPFTDFHRLPGSTPQRDNVLDRGDLIVAIEVPATVEAHASHYLKVRDRASYEFALVSAAAGGATDGRRIRSARIAMGGVAHKPWRLTAAATV